MKKIIYLIIVAGLLYSCSNFLDQKPETNYGTTENFYKNKTDIEYALTGAYAGLRDKFTLRDYMVIMTDVRSDDLDSYSSSGANAGREYQIKMFTAGSDNQIFRDVWKKYYETIYRCNNVIANIKVVNNEKLERQYEAEARFIRSFCYFNIVRLWGAAPLILEPLSTAEIAKCIRNSVEDIYKAIEEDFIFAADVDNLPKTFASTNIGRVTCLTAKAMLGKAYLQQKKYSEAYITLNELINEDNAGTQALLPDITNVFSTAPAINSTDKEFQDYKGWSPKGINKEMMFCIIWNKDIANMGRSALVYYTKSADINEVFKYTSPTCIYEPGDRRIDLMRTIKGTNNDNNLIVKYADIESSLGTYGYSTPVMRWSDVLLMFAEASNELKFDGSAASPALKALNDVRTRSLPDGAYSHTELNSQEVFRKALFLERRLEFPMEMQRWFDLLRSGDAFEAIKAIGIDITAKDLLFPIPNSEVVLRNDPVAFPQNPGY